MIIRRIERDDPEARKVAAMVDGAFDYYDGPFWAWKYGDPGGPKPVVTVAESDGEIVGCVHYLVVPYQLGGGRTLTGLAGGDLYVNPEARRQHVSADLSLESRRLVTQSEPDAGFVVMFTWRALGAHYERLLGYSNLSPGHRQWSKRLDWKPALDRLAAANPDLVRKYPGLAKVDHLLRLEVAGTPKLDLAVGPDGFTLALAGDGPTVRIRASRPEVIAVGRSRWPRSWIAGSILKGRWRVSGSPVALMQAQSIAGAYLEALRVLKRS